MAATVSAAPLRIAVTSGEPAGIGPDLVLDLASSAWPAELVVLGDPALLAERAAQLGLAIAIEPWEPGQARPAAPGRLPVAGVPLVRPAQAGQPDPANAGYVLELLRRACAGCQAGEFAAMVTAPVHKGVINDAGIPFSGHTEFLAELTGSPLPVMLLVAGSLRVALVTTHLPLKAVPAAVTRERVVATGTVLAAGLSRIFGLARPHIVVLGLNPHAGEGGHLGTEDAEQIAPAVAALREQGLAVTGPVPADTAFVDRQLTAVDAVLAMYHDQGLPVLKHHGFGRAVNVTLGLPIIRTSVDHGTALALAGTGRADPGSLRAAVTLAIEAAARSAAG